MLCVLLLVFFLCYASGELGVLIYTGFISSVTVWGTVVWRAGVNFNCIEVLDFDWYSNVSSLDIISKPRVEIHSSQKDLIILFPNCSCRLF